MFSRTLSLSNGNAQQLTGGPPKPPGYDTGFILNIYRNDCVGISLPIPAGWTRTKEGGDTDTDNRNPHAGWPINLLMLGRKTDQSSFNQVVIMVLDGSRFSGTVQDLVARKVQALVDRNPARYELSRNVFPVEYGASGFIVADCKENVHVSGTMYSVYLFTEFRGLLLGIFLVTRSATTLENAADILRHISFDSDQTNAECLVGDNPLTGRIVGVVGR